MKKLPKSIFILGTDTAIGKTTIGSALASSLYEYGYQVGVYKPLESGCQKKAGILIPEDALTLKTASKTHQSIEEINPYAFEEALAPGVCAQREKQSISFSKIKSGYQKILLKSDYTIVEGAGGLLVPVDKRKTNLDLIKYLNIPVLIIARLGLGTINHTLMTLEILKKNKIKVYGVILNQTEKKLTLAHKTNFQVLKNYQVPLLGIFPYFKIISLKKITDQFIKNFNPILPKIKL